MRRTLILLAHAAVGWALCFATIGVGMALTTERTALVVEMFTSVLGTWIPFGLIFMATWLTGASITRRAARRPTAPPTSAGTSWR